MTVVAIPGLERSEMSMPELERKGQRRREQVKEAEEEDRREVEELYSTRPKRVFMAGREYVIPANYFGPKERYEPDVFRASEERGFGFFLFLPYYGGYTKENWRDPLDPRLIKVVEVRPNNKDGSKDGGENLRVFNNLRFFREKEAAFHLYGLDVYRRKGKTRGAVWAGKRPNGEFFFFETSLAPDETVLPGAYPSNPHCDVRYHSSKEGLYIAYRYAQRHIAIWREIDNAMWAKLHEWRVR
jgi:hypothetical protein